MKGRRSRKTPRQGTLEFTGWGGRRKGAGRKPGRGRRKLLHRERAELPRRKNGNVLHVTLRLVREVADVRRWRVFAAFVSLLASAQRDDFRVNEFSLQDGHLHLIVEATTKKTLANGLRALEIRVAKKLNALHGRRGRAIEDRYHARLLKTPREIRNCLVYVLQNALKHARTLGGLSVDPLSSAAWFEGWRDSRVREAAGDLLSRIATTIRFEVRVAPTAAPKTWLLRDGWRRYGLISPLEQPVT